MARKPLNQAAKAFLSGEATDVEASVETVTPTTTTPTEVKDDAPNKLIDSLSLTPQEKPAPMTITILPSRKNKLQQLSQSTGRNMSELIGIALDRMFNDANI